ncbi:hypothetical protein C8A01DRAFT_16589 [Parachaetomium inaequale]|uniref:Uncharacterized protein n=1 Tax=Parachaetomium inaequale TaxID=2588326 RepID=A0AAN6PEH2_9PEZI|nr:hypothetical protein C8A01DRAFT_16589 [Parachaetomium inaequale]
MKSYLAQLSEEAGPPPPYTRGSWPDTHHTQTSSCPHCGTNLSGSRPGDSRDAHVAIPSVLSEADPDCSPAKLNRLKELICAATKNEARRTKPRPRTMRPELAEEEATAQESPVSETLTRVARKMQGGIYRGGETSVDALVKSRYRGRDKYSVPGRLEGVLEAVGAILYAQEWTGNSSQEALDTTPAANQIPRSSRLGLELASEYVYEAMLLVDYGCPSRPIRSMWNCRDYFLNVDLPEFDNFSRFLTTTARRWEQGQIPDSATWDHIAHRMEAVEYRWPPVVDVWNAATLLYYYNTRRKPVSAEDRKNGLTGYTGVLQEMVDEVPTRGTDRLGRKLSLDVHVLIPKFVSKREDREQMMAKAKALAEQHGIPLEVPEPRRGLFERVAGLFLCRKKGLKEKQGLKREG